MNLGPTPAPIMEGHVLGGVAWLVLVAVALGLGHRRGRRMARRAALCGRPGPVGPAVRLRGVNAPAAALRRRLVIGMARDRRAAAPLDIARFADAIAGALAAGHPITLAWDMAGSGVDGSLRESLDRHAAARRQGRGFTGVTSEWGAAEGGDCRTLAALVVVAGESGGRVVPGFRMLSQQCRDRQELMAELRAGTAQARATALLLVVLGWFAAAILGLLVPGAGRFLFATGHGWSVVAVSLLLDIVGLRAITRLTREVLE